MVHRFCIFLVFSFIIFCWISELSLDNPKPMKTISLKDPLIVNKFNLSQLDISAILRGEHNVFLCLNINGDGNYLNAKIDDYPLKIFFPLAQLKTSDPPSPVWFEQFPSHVGYNVLNFADSTFIKSHIARWWATPVEGKLLAEKKNLNITIEAKKGEVMLLIDKNTFRETRYLPGLTENLLSLYAWQNGHKHVEIPQTYEIAGISKLFKEGKALNGSPRAYLVYRFPKPSYGLELTVGCSNFMKIKYNTEPTNWPLVIHIPTIGWILEKNGKIKVFGELNAKLTKNDKHKEIDINFLKLTSENQKILLTPVAPPLPFTGYGHIPFRVNNEDPIVKIKVENFMEVLYSNKSILNKTKIMKGFKFETLLF